MQTLFTEVPSSQYNLLTTGQAATLANFLDSNPPSGGARGDYVARAGLAPNFFRFNPQNQDAVSHRESRRGFLKKSASLLASSSAAPLLAASLAEGTTRAGENTLAATAKGAVAASNPDTAGSRSSDLASERRRYWQFMVQTVREPSNTGLGG